jgi:hypothetical protein
LTICLGRQINSGKVNKLLIEFNIFIDEILNEVNLELDTTKYKIVQFLEDNNWFGVAPKSSEKGVFITEDQMLLYREPLIQFLSTKSERKDKKIFTMFRRKFPVTAKKIAEFFKVTSQKKETIFYVIDFLLFHLEKDIFLMDDNEVADLVEKATIDLIKGHGEVLTDFLSWNKSKNKTSYRKEYEMKNRYSMADTKNAYELDEYLKLLYFLFNEDYVNEKEMYKQAANSKNFSDTWLFLSIHFICSLRFTDLKRIAHPILPRNAEEVLIEIESGTFSDSDARFVLQSITHRLNVLPLTPNKTKAHEHISDIKFTVPESCEVHFGKLFALSEAHRVIAGVKDSTPLIRKITDYNRITSYMGKEIGQLFLNNDFRPRAANKSYLQSI